MKKRFLAVRWIVGLLFIFSGLIKANDPLGLSYKMQEFFEAWGFSASLNDYTLALSLIMNLFEVLAGVAVIIGWRMKLFSWLLLLLIIFFSFLTGYALLSGKIKTCGCFGDCLPLTPLQSFLKDIFLLLLILVLFANKKRIVSSLSFPTPQVLLIICIVAVSWLQWYVLKHLPVIDCLPYKPGKNISEEMKAPTGSIPDRYEITFIYKKNGKDYEFSQDTLAKMADLDSYTYVNRREKVIKGNGGDAKIVDFALQTLSGTDTTLPVLNQGNYYVMLFAKDLSRVNEWTAGMKDVITLAKSRNIPFFLVTGDKDKAATEFSGNPDVHILICDGTVVKTAARVNPTYFIMQQANIKGKWGYLDAGDAKKMMQGLNK
jgi:uncharacterized membrane protein YphA (DoxX/SURF4 family)